MNREKNAGLKKIKKFLMQIIIKTLSKTTFVANIDRSEPTTYVHILHVNKREYVSVGGILLCLKRFLRILRNMLLNVEKKICFLLPGTVNMSLCGLACY